jgi:hypothetical protein
MKKKLQFENTLYFKGRTYEGTDRICIEQREKYERISTIYSIGETVEEQLRDFIDTECEIVITIKAKTT